MDRDAAAWVVAQVPRGRRVVAARRLTGGLTSEVTALTVEDGAGRSHRLVMRRWTGDPWPDGDVDDGRVLVPREAAVLQAVEGSPVPAPALVATDAGGEAAGLPALLMTRVPGRLDLSPADPQAWTLRLAQQLAELHTLTARPQVSAYESWLDLDDVEIPAAAADVLRAGPPPAPASFVHHDFQQFNVLWNRRGDISGVVDWVWAGPGPADADVVHCRLNLCLLYGAERAIAFQAAYEAAAGRRVTPWWDVAGAVSGRAWSADELQRQAGRRLRVDAGLFDERLGALLRYALRRC